MKSKKTLQVPLNSIPDLGKVFRLDLGEEWFTGWQEEDPGLEFETGYITGEVSLAKHGRDILVRGRLKGELTLTCSRCLEEFTWPVEAEFDLLLVPRSEHFKGGDEELSAKDLDLDYYTGEVVDLESILREQIILMVPLKPLCTEGCKGLCPRCGANRNRETCSCPVEESASPLASLAKLKG